MFTPLTVEEIAAALARHPIVDVLEQLGIQPPARWNGSSDYMISCPHPGHADSTPSCIVHPSTDRYHCFGCGAHGDVLQLVRDIEGITSLRAAVEFLDTGSRFRPIDVPPPTPASANPAGYPDLARTPLSRVREVNQAAWQQLTTSTAAAQARTYLARRGIDVTALEREVGEPLAGYTPAHRDGLVRGLRGLGFSTEEILDAGWAIQRDDGLADRFRRRALMPIRDDEGAVIGIAARDITGTARQKYLNTPSTVAFRKGECLYRPTTTPIAGASTVIVCEGTLDALAIATQATARGLGLRVVPVAPSGTALTPRQAQMIATAAPAEIVVCADGDEAGRNAAGKWRELLLDAGAGARPRLVQLPANHDPASWLEAFGAGGLRAILAVALSNAVEI